MSSTQDRAQYQRHLADMPVSGTDICEFGVGDGRRHRGNIGAADGLMDCACRRPLRRPEDTPNTGSSFNCYAEFGMTGANGSTSWQTCMFVEGCDGVLASGLVEDDCGVDGDG